MYSRVILTVVLNLILVALGCSSGDATKATTTELLPENGSGGGVPATDTTISYGGDKDAGPAAEGESGAGGDEVDAEGEDAYTSAQSDSGEASGDDTSFTDIGGSGDDAEQDEVDNSDVGTDPMDDAEGQEGGRVLILARTQRTVVRIKKMAGVRKVRTLG